MNKYIDIHTHNQIQHKNISIINLKITNIERVFIAQKTEHFSLGIHPWDVEISTPKMLIEIENMMSNNKIVAVGECGLDKYSTASLKDQIFYFEDQIKISEKFQKPLIIHCVGYFNEVMALKKIYNPLQKWIIHGFRSKPALAKQLLNCGFGLSFGEKMNPLSVELTPIEKLFIETDESSFSIIDIYNTIAIIKGCKAEDLIAGNQLFKNLDC